MSLKYLGLALCAFLGGIAGSLALTATQTYAAKEHSLYTTNFFNESGKRIAVIGPKAGQGSFFLFDGNGQVSLMMGAYPAGAEKGQSLIGMHDRKNNMRFLFRLHGSKDSPTVVMKDSSGRDKIIFGLDGNSETPYFRYIDSSGRWQNLLK